MSAITLLDWDEDISEIRDTLREKIIKLILQVEIPFDPGEEEEHILNAVPHLFEGYIFLSRNSRDKVISGKEALGKFAEIYGKEVMKDKYDAQAASENFIPSFPWHMIDRVPYSILHEVARASARHDEVVARNIAETVK